MITRLAGWWKHGDCAPSAGNEGGLPLWCSDCKVWHDDVDGWQRVTLPYGSPELETHGPDATRAELIDRPGENPPRYQVRYVMGGCDGCAHWYRRQARVSRMHRAYGRRRR
ncbi:hypothetical protein BDK92_7136 [Micromonospora pisi]|uniref:Uncharacterized protein n=1 Tax=Micromonospora pisi TaxID=589240 RepID=A0A495JUH3_9ACTN|nr:hypothetical protein [Micromonospora pisi]RKR92660.1 hypothetical protein BDK92_7136 [Micromonospora pisi]